MEEKKNQKLKIPVLVALLGVLIMIVSLFLPYITAVGDMAEYLEEDPDRMEIESLELTARDLTNVSLVSVSNVVTAAYGEDDGTVAKVIVIAICGCLAAATLFVFVKKPIAVMIFDLIGCGIFFLLNFLMKDDFVAADKYAWGIGYYTIVIAAVILFAGAIWMLVTKTIIKKQAKEALASNRAE